jgi:hypothetical protein
MPKWSLEVKQYTINKKQFILEEVFIIYICREMGLEILMFNINFSI